MLGFVVCCICALWYGWAAEVIPLALAICGTVFGSLYLLDELFFDDK